MDKMYAQCYALEPADRAITADALLREYPEDEGDEDEDEEEHDADDEENDDGDKGYSE